MGFFGFSKYNDIEETLLDQYVQMVSAMMGMSASEARRIVEDMLDKAIEESKKTRNLYSPSKFG